MIWVLAIVIVVGLVTLNYYRVKINSVNYVDVDDESGESGEF